MPKGYIVASIRSNDMETIGRFAAAAGPVIAEYGGRVLARDPQPEVREGADTGIAVLVEFDDVATARRFYESAGYTAAKAIREAVAETDLRIVTGL
ncbi:protein of unknown function DUF1330 [Dinoroseobacter shibae DFL 12 = DSM 16493]|jgi:uncharacterized protein (DUF1330 family)|uniref:DUF1330 domain-containing protein n=1 Tax=Dinoroseobacter shibae (strain DSM 16493 / NCIMB 14021 / DFL 12) TaxID=398580 RepID=A8LJW3_DINSH|nr:MULTISPECIES: DUF1330 domain-containing protein [Dinoroseobacter]ABV91789.1 protein of unknown function DUF1330 [Dinoroseobacter shibae DFL 12 = DSM 16493]MDD9717185.1 DUF1330 domain-containing protein [Dinoroseobacter sp. PD6]URF46771.1 DUF1330 domain-containing protein [Dinoroseobacter shibae]URF51082.1 DUF1330 domain-containing protein [Dinoroseobacter shibae]